MTEPPAILGLAKLARMVFERVDLQPQWNTLMARATDGPGDAAAMLDLATMLLLTGDREQGLGLQAQALALQSCYRRAAEQAAPSLRVLAIMSPGDMMANTPIDFLLAGSDIELISLYVAPGLTMPSPLPAHDVAFLAIGESEQNQPLLRSLAPLLPSWPAPLLNGDALAIAGLTRDGVCARLACLADVVAPLAVRADRETLASIAAGGTARRPAAGRRLSRSSPVRSAPTPAPGLKSWTTPPRSAPIWTARRARPSTSRPSSTTRARTACSASSASP